MARFCDIVSEDTNTDTNNPQKTRRPEPPGLSEWLTGTVALPGLPAGRRRGSMTPGVGGFQ
jgi:hypothetical protein